jgi:hypothetical protein
MKNLLLLSVIASMSLFNFAHAATSGNLQLQGTIPKVLSLDVKANSAATKLDLTQTINDLPVANVHEMSNSESGYRIYLSSKNSGKLLHKAGDAVKYKIKYGGKNSSLSSSRKEVANVKFSDTKEKVKDVRISYSGKKAETMISGTYSDTLTFTIEAK